MIEEQIVMGMDLGSLKGMKKAHTTMSQHLNKLCNDILLGNRIDKGFYEDLGFFKGHLEDAIDICLDVEELKKNKKIEGTPLHNLLHNYQNIIDTLAKKAMKVAKGERISHSKKDDLGKMKKELENAIKTQINLIEAGY